MQLAAKLFCGALRIRPGSALLVAMLTKNKGARPLPRLRRQGRAGMRRVIKLEL
jgi:hypothetical protein